MICQMIFNLFGGFDSVSSPVLFTPLGNSCLDSKTPTSFCIPFLDSPVSWPPLIACAFPRVHLYLAVILTLSFWHVSFAFKAVSTISVLMILQCTSSTETPSLNCRVYPTKSFPLGHSTCAPNLMFLKMSHPA